MGTVLPHREGKAFLSDLGKFIKGRGITRADLVQSGVPCLRYGEIYTTYGDVTEELTSFVSEDTARRATPLDHGDIIFAASGETAGEIGKAVAWLGYGTAVAGGDTIILRGHGQDPTFLGHALNADDAVRQKSRLGKGHSVVHIHEAELARVSVFLPPVSEQRKIGEILRTWDEAIEKLSLLRQAKEKRFNAVKARLLSPTLEEDWTSVPLLDVASIRKGQQLNKLDMTDGGKYPVWNGGVSPSGYTDSFNTQKYTITVSEGGNSCGFVNYINEPFWLGGHCYAIKKLRDAKIKYRYLYFFLKAHERRIKRLRVGSGLPNIQRNDLLRYIVCYPNTETQDRITRLMDIYDSELKNLQTETDLLTRQKLGLMQKVLTDKCRCDQEAKVI